MRGGDFEAVRFAAGNASVSGRCESGTSDVGCVSGCAGDSSSKFQPSEGSLRDDSGPLGNSCASEEDICFPYASKLCVAESIGSSLEDCCSKRGLRASMAVRGVGADSCGLLSVESRIGIGV